MDYAKPVLMNVGAAPQLVLGTFPNGTDGVSTPAPTKPTPLVLGLDD